MGPGDDPWQPGEIFASARNVYRVLAVREIESRVWPSRWHITAELLGAHGGRIPAGAHVTSSYRRGEGPVEYFGPWTDDLEAVGV